MTYVTLSSDAGIQAGDIVHIIAGTGRGAYFMVRSAHHGVITVEPATFWQRLRFKVTPWLNRALRVYYRLRLWMEDWDERFKARYSV